jgi:uncharacterized protein (TIGR02246 family)
MKKRREKAQRLKNPPATAGGTDLNWFLILLLLLPTMVQAQNSPADEVRSLERAWLDAYEQRDEAAMNRIVAADFVITFPDGSRQTKAEIISSLRMAGRSNGPKFHTENVQARVYGDTVILSGRVVTESYREGKLSSTQKQRYTDTYVKLNGRWQVVASHLSNDTRE